MPRAHTPEQQLRIRTTLLREGEARFADKGLQGVTIAELSRVAGIGKGTFYLYFESKEALFFAIQEQLEQSFKRELVTKLEPLRDQPAALIERFVLAHLDTLEAHPFLRHLLDPSVLASLLEHLPPAVAQAHQAQDRAFYLGLVRGWIEHGVLPAHTDPELIFAVVASAWALALQREVVGERWRDVVGVLARGLARELTGR